MRNHDTLKKQRIRLFDNGNHRCPICLTVFTRQDAERGVANLEDVPAKALGRAIPMCLTCEPCNSRTGRAEQRVADTIHAARRGGERVKLTLSALPEQPQSARITVKPNGDIFAVLPEKTRIPPDEFTRAMLSSESVSVTGPVLRRGEAQMPWLKAAYYLCSPYSADVATGTQRDLPSSRSEDRSWNRVRRSFRTTS